jgi:hypothetical protein
MHADQIAFGIEFETTIPAHDTTPIGSNHHGYQVPWLPEGWKAERDGSIRAMVPGRKGCEFVSPKLRGAAGLREVEEAINAINARGTWVNPAGMAIGAGSCGPPERRSTRRRHLQKVRVLGLEPKTYGLKVRCSTD